MSLQKLLRFAVIASMLIGSSAAAQATQATDDERPPADAPAAKQKPVPSQEAGDTSAIESTGEAETAPAAAKEGGKPPFSVGVAIGWGTDFENPDYNFYGVGFGVRGGYTLDFGLYLGAQVLYFLGGSNAAGASRSEFLAGVDVGYDIKVAPVVIRPSLGVGAAVSFTKSDVGRLKPEKATNADIYVALGGNVVYPISNFFVGGDLRFVDIFATDSVEAVTIMAIAGMNFGK
jgi:hypothetical protein